MRRGDRHRGEERRGALGRQDLVPVPGAARAEPLSRPTGSVWAGLWLLGSAPISCRLGVTGSCQLPSQGPWSGKVLPKPEDIFEASGNDVTVVHVLPGWAYRRRVQPCTHREPCRLVPVPGSLTCEINSLPLGLLQLISFFLAHSAPCIWFSYNTRPPGSGSVLE